MSVRISKYKGLAVEALDYLKGHFDTDKVEAPEIRIDRSALKRNEFVPPKTIILNHGNLETIGEEIAHYLHYLSRPDLFELKKLDLLRFIDYLHPSTKDPELHNQLGIYGFVECVGRYAGLCFARSKGKKRFREDHLSSLLIHFFQEGDYEKLERTTKLMSRNTIVYTFQRCLVETAACKLYEQNGDKKLQTLAKIGKEDLIKYQINHYFSCKMKALLKELAQPEICPDTGLKISCLASL